MIHTVKGFSIVNEAEVDVFLELSCFFDDPVDVGNLISGSSAFSKSSLNIWKIMVHILLKPGLENFEHSLTSVWDESNCAVVWAFFGSAFLWDWNENWPFPVLWPLLSFLHLLAYWVQHFHNCREHQWKTWASFVAQLVKNRPAIQETRVRSLGWEDPLEKEMATHSSILAWRIPRTEEPGRLQSMRSQEKTWYTHHGNPIRRREGEW